MDSVISGLTVNLTPDVFFGVVGDLVPFIVLMIPIALAVYFLRKLIKGAAKAKVRI